ncbi:MAG: hypothetical protein WBQ23_14870 [Bacteroidota bacterium]
MNRKKIPYGTKLPVRLSLEQRDLIADHSFYPGDAFHTAIMEGEEIRVDLTLDDIEEIQGYVAAEANHCKDRKLQKRLDRLFEVFQEFLDTYDDQEEMQGS